MEISSGRQGNEVDSNALRKRTLREGIAHQREELSNVFQELLQQLTTSCSQAWADRAKLDLVLSEVNPTSGRINGLDYKQKPDAYSVTVLWQSIAARADMPLSMDECRNYCR